MPAGIAHAYLRHGYKQNSTGFEQTMHFSRDLIKVGHKMKNVCANDAIELGRSQVIRLSQVGDNSRSRIAVVDVQDIDLRYRVSADRSGISVAQEFQTPPFYIGMKLAQELRQIVPVNRNAAVGSPYFAQR